MASQLELAFVKTHGNGSSGLYQAALKLPYLLLFGGSHKRMNKIYFQILAIIIKSEDGRPLSWNSTTKSKYAKTIKFSWTITYDILLTDQINDIYLPNFVEIRIDIWIIYIDIIDMIQEELMLS